MASPKVMDKDEQLQLCIQRFVSDTQSMINQFSEVFIGELRRFADVCMEFSVAYRNVQEDRQFLTAENKSLKDELDARTAEVDFLGKELREIREENDELIHKLECLNVNSEGEFSMIHDAVRPKNYAVVNSMPTFPRRYSEGIGYDHSTSSVSHAEATIELRLSTEIDSSIPSNSKAQILLTPPIAFKNNSSTLSPNISVDETNPLVIRSHSRDDISFYAHSNNSNSNNNLGTLTNNNSSNDRSPSLDEIRESKNINMVNGYQEKPQLTLSTAASSSAGTFYDCCSMSNIDINDFESNSNRQKLLTITDQIREMFGISNTSSKSSPSKASPDIFVVSEQNDDNHNTCAVVDVKLKQLKNRCNEKSQLVIDQENFIAKSPSPTCYSFNQYFDKYRCDIEKLDTSGKELDDDAIFFLEAPPVQRYNSKKLSKKRKSRKKTSETVKNEDDVNVVVVSDVCHLPLPNGSITRMPMNADSVSIIPSPQIDLNKYLLVEICHIVSPSHFYLIVNDEKIGTNAFEDFLERFQNFYKSIEENDLNGLNERDDEDMERELRLLASIPPPVQALTIGSYWACYIDDELDWRRVQIIGYESKKSGNGENHDTLGIVGEDLVMVKDVDSGYSSMVHSQMIRPLTDEMAHVPAFAIRASLAFIYPRLNSDDNSNNNINNKDHLNEYYDQWPMECCQFFEDMTYDQVLTASVLQIHREDLTETEVAQVLLWCTSAEDFEIFINRKLIELNYANNVADDDLWMEQFSEVNSTSIQQPLDSSNIEVCFNTQLEKSVEVSFHSGQRHQSDGSLMENQNEIAEVFNKDQQRKIKIKTRSKKKKGPNEVKDENKDCQESCKTTAVPIQIIDVESSNNNRENNATMSTISSSSIIDPNSLLHLSPEPKVEVSLIDDDSSESVPKESLLDQYCHTLHHDPRLSNWIIQKHSRHIILKKTLLNKINYLFHVTCYFEPNKFIGILPFGERKLDLDSICQFLMNSNDSLTPFKEFIQEMTEFYRKHQQDKNSSTLRLLPEQCIFEQANSSTIVFFEDHTGLFLRGHIVGKDITLQEKQQQHINQSKSAKDLLTVSNNDDWQKTKKTLSLKRHSIHDNSTKFIIYAIDAGRYFQAPLKHIYHLDDRFKMAKPFAIVCKLHGFPNNECSTLKLRKLIGNKFFGLRFIDTDFSTERFAVELYTFNIDYNSHLSTQSNHLITTCNIIQKLNETILK